VFFDGLSNTNVLGIKNAAISHWIIPIEICMMNI